MTAKRFLGYHYYSSPECNFLALLWRERTKVRVAKLPRALTLSLSRVAGEGDFSLALRNLGSYFFLFISLFVPGQTFSAESQNLTVISYPARPAKLPLWLAQDAGLFEKNGLKVSIKEMNSSEELLKSIQNREGQIYAATANWLVSGIGDGFDLVFIANTGYSVLKLVSRPNITRPDSSKEKKWAPAKLTAARTGSLGKPCNGSDSILTGMLLWFRLGAGAFNGLTHF